MKAPLPRVATLPRVFVLRLLFERLKTADVRASVFEEMERLFPDKSVLHGLRIGVTAPSRGIKDIVIVLKTVVEFFKRHCKTVFVIAAMGSHGGGTPAGQIETLAHRGITEVSVGAKILAELGTTKIDTVRGVEVHLSNHILRDVDRLFVVNRVKEHTDIDWPNPIPAGFYGVQSGLAKGVALGGSNLNAKDLHRHVPGIGLGPAIEIAARCIMEKIKMLGGLAIVENAYHETAFVEGVPACDTDEFFRREAHILSRSQKLMPWLPFSELDILYCQWLGKDKSGQGMHTKLIGRSPYGYQQGLPWQPGMAKIWTIIGSRLTPGSGGNAIGWGLCELSTKRFRKAVNPEITALNCLTALTPLQARPPIILDNDREALEVAQAISPSGAAGQRICFIRSTLELGLVLLGESLLTEARKLSRAEVASDPIDLTFDTYGYLKWPRVS
jgi:hypothetical protein